MRILVINPNSSLVVTAGIAEALRPLGDHFEIVDHREGPETIRTDDDVEAAGEAFARVAASRSDVSGYVTACFSDPGLDLARTRVARPVTGAQEAAILEAAEAAEHFGIIALSERAIPRHLKRIEAMGYRQRLIDELALRDVSAAHSGNDEDTYTQIRALALKLRARGAGAVVLGCAGMSRIVFRLRDELGIPIVEPVAAAGRLALVRARRSPSQ